MHLLHMKEMKCKQTVRQQNTSSVMVLYGLPEAWREEAQQGEMARSNNSGWARNAMHTMDLTSHFCNLSAEETSAT